MADVRIRPVRMEDAAEIARIYAYYVSNTAISFEYTPPSEAEMRNRISNTVQKYPYLVLECGERIVGYAYASRLKARQAYDWCVEISIYLDRAAQKCGHGRRLYEALEAELANIGVKNIYACIACPDAEDEYLTKNSLEFHQHMGFQVVGRLNQCGYKFSHWYHMIYAEKTIGAHDASPKPLIAWNCGKQMPE